MPDGPKPYVSLDRLSVAYQAGGRRLQALKQVTLELGTGRRLAIIGESASGKSTLALAIAGLLPRSAAISGHIAFPARGRRPRLGRDIGIVFQEPGASLSPVLTVGEQIAEASVFNRGRTWAEGRKEAIRLLDRVKLERAGERYGNYPHQFSGGQLQRIAIAAALAGEPSLLIADEPTSALDSVVQQEMVLLLEELARDGALGLIFITHDIALASVLGDEIAVLYAGRLVETGPADRVIRQPLHPYTQALIRTHIDLETPRAARLPEVSGTLPDLVSPPAGCRFAPRCPHVMEICAQEPPWIGRHSDGAACFRAGGPQVSTSPA